MDDEQILQLWNMKLRYANLEIRFLVHQPKKSFPNVSETPKFRVLVIVPFLNRVYIIIEIILRRGFPFSLLSMAFILRWLRLRDLM